MKNINNFILLLITAFSFFACSNDDDSYSNAPLENQVRFEESGDISISEGSDNLIRIPIYMNYRSNGDTTVSYSITGDNNSYEDLTQNPGQVVIPAGERTATITLKAVDNDIFAGEDSEVVLTIDSVDNGYTISSNEDFVSKVITFKDDECEPLEDRNAFVGDLVAEDVGYGYISGVTGRLSDEYGACNVLIISGNLPNSNNGLSPDFEFFLTPTGNNEGTVEVPKQPYGDNFYNASGTYANGVITVSYSYTLASGSEIWSGENVINK